MWIFSVELECATAV